MGASEAKRKKQNKKNENETKNIFAFCKDGIKECNGQDSYHYFGFEVDNTNRIKDTLELTTFFLSSGVVT